MSLINLAFMAPSRRRYFLIVLFCLRTVDTFASVFGFIISTATRSSHTAVETGVYRL